MSDNDNTAAANGSSPQFTERELQLLGWAMQSLKSGPPEVRLQSLSNDDLLPTFAVDRLRQARRLRWYEQSALGYQRLGQDQGQVDGSRCRRNRPSHPQENPSQEGCGRQAER